ncbi:SDR family oxidoreductase [Methylorubrum suomiense]|uniref:Protein YeeZ n=1 Tax=Methylorubrum suomiense TaxID=144191 RepID=A0ABQ4UXR1_9HYPH|nr:MULTISPECIES: SDR family oxidoreductase [Methylobacteriaceae]GJE76615.1 Protein YeeZ [Methylorubrum suomiense]
MNLFVFGFGFSARHFAESERSRFTTVRGTVTEADRARKLAAETGFTLRAFGPETDDPGIADDLADTDILLVSAPPGPHGDTALSRYRAAIAASRIRWIGYLSTIGVYGDQGGAWIDESTIATPKSARSRERLAVEEAWLALGAETGKAVQVFRLSGIYGPGRNPIVKLREGRTQRIVKPGQVFNRIHVADIATTLAASIDRPRGGAIYNVTDDEPAPPQTVIEHAAALTGLPLPPAVDFETADLSPMARSFYGENKRVRNGLIRGELGVTLAYPTYREGLAGLVSDAERGR